MAPAERPTSHLKFVGNDRIVGYIHSQTTLDFIVIADGPRKFIDSTKWPGNGEWLLSKNIWKSTKRVDSVSFPLIPVWVPNSLGLNSIDSFYTF
jgi:hypothetical protein